MPYVYAETLIDARRKVADIVRGYNKIVERPSQLRSIDRVKSTDTKGLYYYKTRKRK